MLTSSPSLSTPDLADENPENVNAVELQFRSFGGHTCFYGQAVTVKCFEDNSRVKELVNTPGEGKVLVVDGGGSMRKALLGDLMAEAAIKNGWAGAIINGLVRDVEILEKMPFGVKALGTIPVKSTRLGEGQAHIDIAFGNVSISENSYIYCDANGVLVADKPLI